MAPANDGHIKLTIRKTMEKGKNIIALKAFNNTRRGRPKVYFSVLGFLSKLCCIE
jgi:hypothetical protein